MIVMRWLSAGVLFFFLVFQVVYVPRAYATMGASASGPLLRLVVNNTAPAVVTTAAPGLSLVMPLLTVAGTAYFLYKSGAIDAIKAWWNSWPSASIKEYTKSGVTYQAIWSTSNGNTYCEIKQKSNGAIFAPYQLAGTGTSWSDTWKNNWVLAKLGAGGAYSGEVPGRPDPGATFDLSSWPNAPSIAFPSNSIYATPNSAISGNDKTASTPMWMTDQQADDFIERNGLQQVQDDGTIDNPSDNVSVDTKSMIPYLNQIQTNTSKIPHMSEGIDCVAITLNNARAAIEQSNRFLDNISAQVDDLTAYSTIMNSQNMTRWDELREKAKTRIPFTLIPITGVAVTTSEGEAADDIDIGFNLGGSSAPRVTIAKPAAIMHQAHTGVRVLMSAFFWSICMVAIYRKVTG